MTNPVYQNKSIGILLGLLRKTISEIKNNFNQRKDIKIRYLIQELKSRDLSKLQRERFNKLIIRYMWI